MDGHYLGWQSKKFKIKASQIPRNEAYLSYVAVTRGAAQRRYWAFYEAINRQSIAGEDWVASLSRFPISAACFSASLAVSLAF